MTVSTPTTGAVFIPEVWAKDIMTARKDKLIALKVIDHQYESDVLSKGDTVHITAIAPLTAGAITPGNPIVPAAATETEQTLVVNKYFGVGVELQDMLKKQSAYDLRKPYVDEMSYALAKEIDKSIMALHSDVDSGNIMTPIVAATGVKFADIIKANILLDSANVPMEDRCLIVGAATLGDLRKEAEFHLYDNTGEAGLVKGNLGLVGTIYGAPVYFTNAVAVDTGSQMNLLLHKSAFAAAVQLQPDIEYQRDIKMKSDIITGSALWGVKCIRPDHAVVIPRLLA